MGIGADDTEKRNATLKIISDAGNQLNALIGDILDYSKIEAGKAEVHIKATQLSAVFESARPIVERLVDSKHLTFELIQKSDRKVLVDQNRLNQILLNFASNGVKYTESGGHLELGCVETADGHMRLYVSDNGIGIDDSIREHIFSPFERGRFSAKDVPGAGLGLSICKQLTEQMNGRIGFESVRGEGTTFWVEFPIAEPREAPASPVDQTSATNR